MTSKLVVIAIAGLERDLLEDGVRAGLLPAFSGLKTNGRLTTLVTPTAPSTPSAWASLSTGASPAEHNFTSVSVWGPAGLQPSGHADWAVTPVWERLARQGVKTASICWPGTYPGNAWAGVHIDQRYCAPSGGGHLDWPLPLDVAPAEYRDDLREIRVHPTDVSFEMIMPLASEKEHIAKPLAVDLAIEISRIATLQAGAELILDTGADCTFVYLDCLETIARSLGARLRQCPDVVWSLLDQSIYRLIGDKSLNVIILSLGDNSPGFILEAGETGSTRSPGSISSRAVANKIFEHFGLFDPRLPAIARSTRALTKLPEGGVVRNSANPSDRDVDRLKTFGFVLFRPDAQIERDQMLATAARLLPTDPRGALDIAKAVAASTASIVALGIEASAYVALECREELADVARRIGLLSPDHPWQHLALGALHGLDQDLTKARPHLERVETDGDPDDRARAGTIWLMLKRNAEAGRVFRTVLDDSPWHLGALLGLLSTQTVRGIEAERVLRRVLVIEPGHEPARAALNELLISLGRSREVSP